MAIIGTSYFPSIWSARKYYAYETGGTTAPPDHIERKIAEGLIHIGKPDLKPGQLLTLIDNGTRYAIVDGK